jgi:hypothetical protein
LQEFVATELSSARHVPKEECVGNVKYQGLSSSRLVRLRKAQEKWKKNGICLCKCARRLRIFRSRSGTVAIEFFLLLLLAQELMKTDPKAYPTMAEAMQKVGDLRTQKMG